MSNYDEYYYPNVCHVCKRRDLPLSTCKSCKAYRYCSVEHQKIHWPAHRLVCGALNKYSSSNGAKNCFSIVRNDDWAQTRINVKLTLERDLGRPLTSSENQMWMFPRACAVCHETDNRTLFDCKKCPTVSYCSKKHESYAEHEKFCSMMSFQCDYYRTLSTGSLSLNIIPNANISFNDLECEIFDNSKNLEFSNVRRSEKFSHIFTMMHVMKLTGIVSNYFSFEEKLTVHIVGAVHDYEYIDRQICELLLHWISNLRTITIVFVGPELVKYDCDDWSMCDSCQLRNAKVCYEYKNVLYSEYYSSACYSTPDIIAIFNCGFNEFNDSTDTWKNSLPLLTIPNVPLLITSYTYKEALDDFNKLSNNIEHLKSCDILEFCSRNKYRGLLPLRDWINPQDVYYVNNYFSVIKKTSIV